KYSPISELGHFATEYAESLFDALQIPIFICDRDEVIAVSGDSKKDYLQKDGGAYIEEAIEGRFNTLSHDKITLEIVCGIEYEVAAHAIRVIIANVEPSGAVLAVAKDDQSISEVEHKVIETAANFLGKQME